MKTPENSHSIRYPFRESAENKETQQLVFTATHWDGSPYNKAKWEIETCRHELTVSDYDGTGAHRKDAWTQINIEENYRNEGSDRPINRAIMITLNEEERRALIQMLVRDDEMVIVR